MTNTNTIKVLKIIDQNINLIHLPRGTYLVDGKPIEIKKYDGEDVQCKSTEIREICRASIISHFEDSDSNKKEKEEYQRELETLKKKGEINEDGDLTFESLDDEYNYKKFQRTWIPIYRTIISYGDPLPVEEFQIQLETGNKFIKPILSTQIDNVKLYTYQKQEAQLQIAINAFKQIGASQVEDNTWNDKTVGGNYFSISKLSHLKYTKFAGRYLFNQDRFSDRTPLFVHNTLEKCREMYEEDKKEIEAIIKTHYALHLKEISIKSINLSPFIEQLKTLQQAMIKIEPKVKSSTDFCNLQSFLSSIIQGIEEQIVKTIDKEIG